MKGRVKDRRTIERPMGARDSAQEMDPTQLYETTIYNRDDGRAFSFVTVPGRSLAFAEAPPAEALARDLGLEPIAGTATAAPPVYSVAPLEGWSLPFFIDALMGRWNGPQPFFEWRFYSDVPKRRGPSEFAQHLAYARVVPFESSPLEAKSLVELITGGAASAAVGYLTGHPLFVLFVAAGIIVCGTARGVADALRIGARTKLLAWMGVDDPEAPAPPDDDSDDLTQ